MPFKVELYKAELGMRNGLSRRLTNEFGNGIIRAKSDKPRAKWPETVYLYDGALWFGRPPSISGEDDRQTVFEDVDDIINGINTDSEDLFNSQNDSVLDWFTTNINSRNNNNIEI